MTSASRQSRAALLPRAHPWVGSRSAAQLLPCSFQLEREIERSLVLDRTPLGGIAQADLDQTEVEPDRFSLFDGCRHEPIVQKPAETRVSAGVDGASQ
jgi:hypothetical protein